MKYVIDISFLYLVAGLIVFCGYLVREWVRGERRSRRILSALAKEEAKEQAIEANYRATADDSISRVAAESPFILLSVEMARPMFALPEKRYAVRERVFN